MVANEVLKLRMQCVRINSKWKFIVILLVLTLCLGLYDVIWNSRWVTSTRMTCIRYTIEKEIFSFLTENSTICDRLFENKYETNNEVNQTNRTLDIIGIDQLARAKFFKRNTKREVIAEYSSALADFEDELKRQLVVSKIHNRRKLEGHSGEMIKQTLTYFLLAKKPFVKTICETGFNTGHSTLLWLTAKKNIAVYSFDIGTHPFAKAMATYLQKKFPQRLTVTWGDSKYTVPKFIKENQNIKCDIISIDGGHHYPEAKADLVNMRLFANSCYNLILLDDHHYVDVNKAWHEELEADNVSEHFNCNFMSVKRGFLIGTYI